MFQLLQHKRISFTGLFSFTFPANIYQFKVNNRNAGKRYEIYSKLTFPSVAIADFEDVNVCWVTIIYHGSNSCQFDIYLISEFSCGDYTDKKIYEYTNGKLG